MWQGFGGALFLGKKPFEWHRQRPALTSASRCDFFLTRLRDMPDGGNHDKLPAHSCDPGSRCMADFADWYVGQSTPLRGASAKAVNVCAQLGFRAWLPQVVAYRNKTVRNRPVWDSGRKLREKTVEPLFPGGYWFVSFSLFDPSWGKIMRDENVARLVTKRTEAGVVPRRLPLGFVETMQSFGRAGDGALPYRLIDALKTKEWADAGDMEDEPDHNTMPVGTLGTILEGAFTSFPGRVLEDGGDRLWIAAEIFGRETRLELDRNQFEPTMKTPRARDF